MRLLMVVLGLIVSTLAIAAPTLPSHSGEWAGKGLARHADNKPEPPPRRQHGSTTILQKRVPNLQIKYMKIYQLTVPIRLASLQLTNFYSRVLQASAGNWASLQPQRWLRITQDSFEMIIHSSGSTIPWSLISEVAINMQALTTMGFTGTYDLVYTDNRFVFVFIEFRIIWQ